MDNSSPVIATTLYIESYPQTLPLGAACIVSAIKHDTFFARIPVQLCDFTMEDSIFSGCTLQEAGQRIATVLAAQNPRAVCFFAYVWNIIALEDAAFALKKILPNCLLVAGGPEVTMASRSFTAFDYVVVGEVENAVPQFLKAVFSGSCGSDATCNISGVYSTAHFSAHNDTIDPAVLSDSTSLPSPYIDGTLNLARYGSALWELSRREPFAGAYCFESKGIKNVRNFPLERLRKELQFFIQSGIEQVYVLDPTYNADRRRAIEILTMIRESAPDIYFNFEVRLEFIDRELARLFASIPCSLQINLQSADEKVLANVNRTFNRKEFIKKIGLLNADGVIFGFDLIYGLPGDTWNGFLASIDFALNLYPNHLDINPLAVLPGTMLYDTAAATGLQWIQKPPYTVTATPGFSGAQLEMAEELAAACSLFYTKGRAVSWFLAVLRPLKMKPSAFFSCFAAYLKHIPEFDGSGDSLSHRAIEELQLSFLHDKYREKKLLPLWDAVTDIVKLNGALCRALAEQETTDIEFHWHPEDILGGDSLDIALFVQEVCRESGTVRVFPGKEGPDFRILA